MTSQQPDPIWVPTGGQRPEDVVDLEAVDRPDVLVDLAALAPAGSRS